jgi:hypothetical protein
LYINVIDARVRNLSFLGFIPSVLTVLTGMVCGSAISGPLFHPGPNTTISVHNAFYTGKVQHSQQQLQTSAASSTCLQQQAVTAGGEVSSGGNYVSVAPGVYASPPHFTQVQQQQQPVSPSQPITASADVLQVCMLFFNC